MLLWLVMVAKGLPSITSSSRISLEGSALDFAKYVESLGVVDGLNQEIQNLFLNNGIRGMCELNTGLRYPGKELMALATRCFQVGNSEAFVSFSK